MTQLNPVNALAFCPFKINLTCVPVSQVSGITCLDISAKMLYAFLFILYFPDVHPFWYHGHKNIMRITQIMGC
jgi:hypothetical protein